MSTSAPTHSSTRLPVSTPALSDHLEIAVPIIVASIDELVTRAKLEPNPHLMNPLLFSHEHVPAKSGDLQLVMCTTQRDMTYDELVVSMGEEGLGCAGLRHGLLVAVSMPRLQLEPPKILLPGAVSLRKIDDQFKYPFLGTWGTLGRPIVGLRPLTACVESGTRVLGVCTLPSSCH